MEEGKETGTKRRERNGSSDIVEIDRKGTCKMSFHNLITITD